VHFLLEKNVFQAREVILSLVYLFFEFELSPYWIGMLKHSKQIVHMGH